MPTTPFVDILWQYHNGLEVTLEQLCVDKWLAHEQRPLSRGTRDYRCCGRTRIPGAAAERRLRRWHVWNGRSFPLPLAISSKVATDGEGRLIALSSNVSNFEFF